MNVFVFDLDGVVCRGPMFSAALEAEHGIPARSLTPFFQGPFGECLVGRRDLAEELGPFLTDWGWPGSVEAFLAFWFERERGVDAAVIDAVCALRRAGHRCVLGTNQEQHRTAFIRREMRLSEIFDAVHASCELGAKKPSPAFFTELERTEAQPTATFWLIDDMEENVLGARAAGWRGVHYKTATDLGPVWAAAGLGFPPAADCAQLDQALESRSC